MIPIRGTEDAFHERIRRSPRHLLVKLSERFSIVLDLEALDDLLVDELVVGMPEDVRAFSCR